MYMEIVLIYTVFFQVIQDDGLWVLQKKKKKLLG